MKINGAWRGKKRGHVVVILGTMLKRSLPEEVPFEQRPRRDEGVNPAKLWEKRVLAQK